MAFCCIHTVNCLLGSDLLNKCDHVNSWMEDFGLIEKITKRELYYLLYNTGLCAVFLFYVFEMLCVLATSQCPPFYINWLQFFTISSSINLTLVENNIFFADKKKFKLSCYLSRYCVLKNVLKFYLPYRLVLYTVWYCRYSWFIYRIL